MVKNSKVSLLAQKDKFSEQSYQLELLNKIGGTPFSQQLQANNLFPLKPINVDVFQLNLGRMCNQVCKHCHVDAGPDRKEIMTKEVMEMCLVAIDSSQCSTVDLTGGAPEMNPNFRWFIEQLSQRNKKIIVRCNLTIILANKKYYDLPEFFKKHKIEVVSSLPYFNAIKTDSQRGDGVFEQSIKALQMLNKVGYGAVDSGLILNLVYNPSGAFLPPDQKELENEFKLKLSTRFNVVFNHLFAITNIPVSRYLQYLVKSDNYERYMEKLINSFNIIAAENVMCRTTISVSWDGALYDCDFNQMLDLKIKNVNHISAYSEAKILKREIIINQHCYGCTAGSGSSCGGTTA